MELTPITFNDLEYMAPLDLRCGLSVLLFGEPGIGKSSCIKTIADYFDGELYILSCGFLSDRADLTMVRPDTDEDGEPCQKFYPHVQIHSAIKAAKKNPNKKIILFLDEINKISEDITNTLNELVTTRLIGDIYLPENILFIAAANENGNIQTALDSANLSRYSVYKIIPDVETFFAKNPNLYPPIKSILQKHPDWLYSKINLVPNITVNNTNNDDDDDNNINAVDIAYDSESEIADQMITTPRSITALSNTLNMMSDEEIVELITRDTLSQFIFAKTGYTEFSNTLINTLVSTKLSSVNTTNNMSLDEPAKWSEIKSISDLTELQNKFVSYTKEEQSDILLYALYNSSDNKLLINTITPLIPTTNDITNLRTFTQLAVNNKLHLPNLSTFLNSNTVLSNTIKQLVN